MRENEVIPFDVAVRHYATNPLDNMTTAAAKAAGLARVNAWAKMGSIKTIGELKDVIRSEWEDKLEGLVGLWRDKDKLYCEFSSEMEKHAFLDEAGVGIAPERMKMNNNRMLLGMIGGYIERPNLRGEHVRRSPIEMVIYNVPREVSVEAMRELLVRRSQDELSIPYECRQLERGLGRAMRFKTSQEGFRRLIREDSWPMFASDDGQVLCKMKMRIWIRPRQCKFCYTFDWQDHICMGLCCGNCGMNGHKRAQCRQNVRFCMNCKEAGHRAQDPWCPIYMRELSQALRKYDLPLEYLEDEAKRAVLMKLIQR